MSIDVTALQEMPEQEPGLEFCCDYPFMGTFVSCLGCTFTR